MYNYLKWQYRPLDEYTNSLIDKEVNPIQERNQKRNEEIAKLEAQREELNNLLIGFDKVCREYDKRLPPDLTGSCEERLERYG